MRVLVVDDHQPTIDLMELTLAAFGHTVFTANSVLEALKLVAVEGPDLILSDLTFPDSDDAQQDGYALARVVRSNPDYGHIRIVAITGVTSAAAAHKARDSGFDEVVVKPFDVEKLIRRIDHYRDTSPD